MECTDFVILFSKGPFRYFQRRIHPKIKFWGQSLQTASNLILDPLTRLLKPIVCGLFRTRLFGCFFCRCYGWWVNRVEWGTAWKIRVSIYQYRADFFEPFPFRTFSSLVNSVISSPNERFMSSKQEVESNSAETTSESKWLLLSTSESYDFAPEIVDGVGPSVAVAPLACFVWNPRPLSERFSSQVATTELSSKTRGIVCNDFRHQTDTKDTIDLLLGLQPALPGIRIWCNDGRYNLRWSVSCCKHPLATSLFFFNGYQHPSFIIVHHCLANLVEPCNHQGISLFVISRAVNGQ